MVTNRLTRDGSPSLIVHFRYETTIASMSKATIKLVGRLAIVASIVSVVALLLSAIFAVPYVYTALGFAALIFCGHLVVIDEDMPGGWSKPDGIYPVPWLALAIKGAVFFAFGIAALIPEIQR
jgi:hypothetical protein